MNSLFKIIISMIIWGSVGLFVKNIDLPSMEIVFLRAIIASIILISYGLIFKTNRKNSLNEYQIKTRRKNICFLIASGTAIGLNWIFLFQSYKYTTISNSTLSYYFAPVFVILLSPFILKEKLTKSKLIAIMGAMLGLFLILSNQSSSTSISYNHTKGITFGLIAAIFYASVILLNKYIKDLSGYEMTVIQISTAALLLLPIIIYRNSIHISSIKSLVFILIVGIVHTGIPYLAYFSAIKDLKAQTIAVVSYIDPISAVIFSTIFLKEKLTLFQLLGGFLILLSTFLGNYEKNTNSHVNK
ncbi:EamA family transporter [Clostridium sp. PL3]|uniref:EamA family transporter n=1 Tax=Clostridium thailandense TaxID=2794346 RepID=A0A949TW55_9CLOT|nr:DMT family transporter [Clostridium thailandense]MBV7273563.1 EamA family transporter [Clostridium thailandense]